MCWTSKFVAACAAVYVVGLSQVAAAEPVFQRAAAIKLALEQDQASLRQTQLAMQQRVAATEGDLSPLLAVLAIEDLTALRQVVQEIRLLVKDILGRRRSMDGIYSKLREELKESPGVFAAAGRACRGYAAEEPYAQLKADYVMLAELWEKLSAVAASQYESIEAEQKHLGSMMSFLERSDLYLERLDTQLAALPMPSGSEGGKEHLEMLRRFIDRFSALRGALQGAHERIGAGKAEETSAPAKSKQTLYKAQVLRVLPTLGEAVLDVPPGTVGLRPVMPLVTAKGSLKGLAILRPVPKQTVVWSSSPLEVGDLVLYAGQSGAVSAETTTQVAKRESPR